MTLSFGTAGIGQVYLERILGLGYLDTQLKLQVHFLMLIATASVFATGAALFIWNFFRTAPRSVAAIDSSTSAPDLAPASHANPAVSG
jgi:nitric oxide reductase subunit B